MDKWKRLVKKQIRQGNQMILKQVARAIFDAGVRAVAACPML
jgi:hypothetical protein